MQQETYRVIAKRAEYYDAEQKLILTGQPKAWDTAEHNELAGEEIVFFWNKTNSLSNRRMFVSIHAHTHPGRHDKRRKMFQTC